MEYTKGNHSIYNLTYHVVLVTKDRKQCINSELSDRLKLEIERLLSGWDSKLIEYNSDLDHIHFIMSLNPRYSVSKSISVLKGVTSRIIRRDYPDYIKNYLYGDSFWSDSYFISTTGGVSLYIIKKYIENQSKPKRKYEKRK